MKLRKLAALSLAAAMAAGTLAGCSSNHRDRAIPRGEASEGDTVRRTGIGRWKGTDYYLNFKPEVADVWVELAEKVHGRDRDTDEGPDRGGPGRMSRP